MIDTNTLLTLGSSPAAIAVAIFLATFVLEDAATVAAALLAASGAISPPLALATLFAGILGGDLALYGLGSAARTQQWARHRIGDERIERGRLWLNDRLTASLVTARFVPGMRLPVYSASGFLGVGFRSFAAIAACASLVWTVLAFSVIYMIGETADAALGSIAWMLGAILLVAFFAGPWLVGRLRA